MLSNFFMFDFIAYALGVIKNHWYKIDIELIRVQYPKCASQVVLVIKNSPANAGDKRHGFDPSVRKSPWRSQKQSILVFLSGESYGQRLLVGYSPWGLQRVRHDWSDVACTDTWPVRTRRPPLSPPTCHQSMNPEEKQVVPPNQCCSRKQLAHGRTVRPHAVINRGHVLGVQRVINRGHVLGVQRVCEPPQSCLGWPRHGRLTATLTGAGHKCHKPLGVTPRNSSPPPRKELREQVQK